MQHGIKDSGRSVFLKYMLSAMQHSCGGRAGHTLEQRFVVRRHSKLAAGRREHANLNLSGEVFRACGPGMLKHALKQRRVAVCCQPC